MLYVIGSSGPEVQKINEDLVSHGYLDEADDQFDEATEQAVMYFQEDAGLKVDGKVGPLTWAALFPETTSLRRPPLQSQLVTLFGRPDYTNWRKQWITWIDLSEFKDQLGSVSQLAYKGQFGFSGHVQLKEPTLKVFRALRERGLLEEITSFGGCFNIRPMRGRSIPSVHSYGLALDLNAPENPFNRDSYAWTDEFAKTWAEYGWEWGYIWDSPVDSMHFQWAWTRNWSEYEGDFIPRG